MVYTIIFTYIAKLVSKLTYWLADAFLFFHRPVVTLKLLAVLLEV